MKNVRSVGCDYSHIFEKRLDFRRSPYFEALEEKRPIINPRGNYFIAIPGVKEVEYILPMTNGLTTLQLIAGSRKEAEENLEHLNWIQRFQKLPEEREFIEIQRNNDKQNDLIERADLAFDCSESALATFDIYGRVIRRNSSFNRMIQEAQLSISNASCIEIMATLTGRSQNDCRKIFRQVILDHHPETIVMADSVSGQSPKVMYVKPMHLIEEERRTSIEMHGLLIEIVDGAPFESLDLWNQRLASTLIPDANEKSQQLEASREKIRAIGETAQSPQEALHDLFGSVGSTVDDIVSVLQQCKDMSQRRVSEDADNYFSVDAVSIWQSVVSGFEEMLANRSIRIKASFESDAMMVSANPLLLDKVFSTTVHFLVSDAFDDSEVRVNFSKGPTGISCLFSNEGGGTPIEALRRSLQASEGTTGSSKPESSQGVGQNLTPAQSDQLAEIEAWVEKIWKINARPSGGRWNKVGGITGQCSKTCFRFFQVIRQPLPFPPRFGWASWWLWCVICGWAGASRPSWCPVILCRC